MKGKNAQIVFPKEGNIEYVRGYKYQLKETRRFLIPSLSDYAGYEGTFIEIQEGGLLVIKAGYAWDGASGPTMDTKTSMRGSLVHDPLYELMRIGILPQSFRAVADEALKQVCVLDKMWKWRASLWQKALSLFGGKNVLASRRRITEYAP